jgi:putative PIN family toxin of toxin-antitoxin system
VTSERRFVFDTNVVVSALLFYGSKPYQALEAAQNLGRVLRSESTLQELQEVLRRSKFDRYVLAPEREIFLITFERTTQLIDVTEQVSECRDPKDNQYLELAVSGQAECIVTGDADLLVLNPFREIAILKVQEFLERGLNA